MLRFFFAALSFFLSFACNFSDNKSIVIKNERDSSKEVALVDPADLRMNAAIARAKKTFPSFLRVFKEGCDECRDFTVKYRFNVDEVTAEHMWLEDLHLVKGKLHGILTGVPSQLDRIHTGDTIEVVQDSLSDWMYAKNNQLIGGFTLKVLYDDLSPAERKKLEEEMGVKIK